MHLGRRSDRSQLLGQVHLSPEPFGCMRGARSPTAPRSSVSIQAAVAPIAAKLVSQALVESKASPCEMLKGGSVAPVQG